MTADRTSVDDPPPSSTPSSTRAPVPFAVPVGVVFTVVLMAYATWSVYTGHGRYRPLRVGYGADSELYMQAARAPVWSFKFLAAPNGALFPLLAKVCLRNMRAIVLVQTAFAAGAWIYLAHTIGSRMRRPVARTFAFVMVLLLGAGPPIVFWNVAIATESLAISLLCVVVALWIRLVAGEASHRQFVAFAVVLGALACTRGSYAVLWIIVAGIAFLIGFLRRAVWRRAAVIAAVCLITAITNIGLSNHAGRWFDPLNETIAVRLLGSHEATHYFRARGMPYDFYVKRLHEKNAIVFLAYNVTYGKEYRKYREWLLKSGRRTYTTFLLTHPVWVVDEAFRDRKVLLTPNLRDYGRTFYIEPRGPWLSVGKVGYPQVLPLLDVWTGLALIAGGVLWRRRRDRALLLATGVVALLVVPHFLLTYHGDALETDRHAIGAAVQLRIVLVTITAMVLDDGLARWSGWSRRRRSIEA
jgi:hypothetical protein